MPTQQLIVVLFAYLIALAVVVYFTKPTWRRFAGALAGGASAGWLLLGAVALGNQQGWWRVPIHAMPGGLTLLYFAGAVSCSPIYLITWRVTSRFGSRGLAVCLILAAIIGPPRDYLIAALYPKWMVFAPGVAPVFADAATYLGIVGLGHAVMRLVAGPARREQDQIVG